MATIRLLTGLSQKFHGYRPIIRPQIGPHSDTVRMPLTNIKLPAEDVRLIEFEGTVFKIKLSYNPCSLGLFLPCSYSQLNKQVEEVLRAVLYLKQFDTLMIRTEHFYVECTLQTWGALRVIGFKRDGIRLQAHPVVICIKFTPHGLHSATTSGAQKEIDLESDASASKRQKSYKKSQPSTYGTNVAAESWEGHKNRSTEQQSAEYKQQEQDQHQTQSDQYEGYSDRSNRETSDTGRSNRESREAQSPQGKKKAAKKAHKTVVQFVEPVHKSSRSNLSVYGIPRDRIPQQSHSITGMSSIGSGDHIAEENSPRMSQMSLDASGEGNQKPPLKKQFNVDESQEQKFNSPLKKKKDSLATFSSMATSRRTSPHKSQISPKHSHTMMTSQKSPQEIECRKRRSGFSETDMDREDSEKFPVIPTGFIKAPCCQGKPFDEEADTVDTFNKTNVKAMQNSGSDHLKLSEEDARCELGMDHIDSSGRSIDVSTDDLSDPHQQNTTTIERVNFANRSSRGLHPLTSLTPRPTNTLEAQTRHKPKARLSLLSTANLRCQWNSRSKASHLFDKKSLGHTIPKRLSFKHQYNDKMEALLTETEGSSDDDYVLSTQETADDLSLSLKSVTNSTSAQMNTFGVKFKRSEDQHHIFRLHRNYLGAKNHRSKNEKPARTNIGPIVSNEKQLPRPTNLTVQHSNDLSLSKCPLYEHTLSTDTNNNVFCENGPLQLPQDSNKGNCLNLEEHLTAMSTPFIHEKMARLSKATKITDVHGQVCIGPVNDTRVAPDRDGAFSGLMSELMKTSVFTDTSSLQPVIHNSTEKLNVQFKSKRVEDLDGTLGKLDEMFLDKHMDTSFPTNGISSSMRNVLHVTVPQRTSMFPIDVLNVLKLKQDTDSGSTMERLFFKTCVLPKCSICGKTSDGPGLSLQHSKGHSNKRKYSTASAMVDSAAAPSIWPKGCDYTIVNDGQLNNVSTVVASPKTLTYDYDSATVCTPSQEQPNVWDQSYEKAVVGPATYFPTLTNELFQPTLPREDECTVVRPDNYFIYNCVRCDTKVIGSWNLILHIKAHMVARQ